MTWWLEAAADWDAGEARRAFELLAHAYDDRPGIEAIARASGLVWRSPAGEATPAAIWRTVLADAARVGLLNNLFTTVLADRSVAMFHDLLRELLGTGRLESLDEPADGLQAVTDPLAGLRDPRELEQVLADARRRTALIEVNGVPSGTGFLIGRDLLLTAAHVVGRKCPPDPAPQVTAVFDYYAGSGAPAESGVRVAAVEWLAGRPPTQAEREGRYDDWNAAASFLDYAIYRLAQAIGGEPTPDDPLGRQRGFYPVNDAAYDFQAGGELTIHQHPLRAPQAMTKVRGGFSLNPGCTRVRYTGNTLPGSSGSACVDERGRLVALHHFAAKTRNQGVPIRAIAVDLIAQGKAALLSSPAAPSVGVVPLRAAAFAPPSAAAGASLAAIAPRVATQARPAPFATLAFGPKPFVNRQNLRDQIEGMFGGSGRVLVIEGSPGVGKSYSYQLLTHLAAEHPRCRELQALAGRGIRTHELDLDGYANAPTEGLRQALIDDLLLRLGVVAPNLDRNAQAAHSFADLTRWLPTQLHAQGVLHWLFIDNLDRFALERDGVKDLIASLSNMIEKDYSIPLRLVLVVGDKRAQLQKELARWAKRDTVVSLSPAEAERWLRNSLAARGITVAETTLRQRVARFHSCTPAPNAETLAIELADALDELAGGAA